MSCKIWKRVFCDKLDISRVFFPNTFPTHFVCSAQCAALHFHFLQANLPVTDKRAISGHSMGGHGALTIGLKNPERQPGQTCTHTHTLKRYSIPLLVCSERMYEEGSQLPGIQIRSMDVASHAEV